MEAGEGAVDGFLMLVPSGGKKRAADADTEAPIAIYNSDLYFLWTYIYKYDKVQRGRWVTNTRLLGLPCVLTIWLM